MKTKMEQFPAKNPNPVLSVGKNGTILYSNEAGEPLLNEWGVRVGEKLPPHIENIVQRVISRNSSEKTEVKAESRIYLLSFHPFPEEECVNIYGFDVSDREEFEEKLRESEKRYHLLFENMLDGYAYCRMLYDDCGHPVDFIYIDTNIAFERLTGLKDVNGKRATEAILGIKETHPELFDIYDKVASTGQPQKFEIDFKPFGMWLSISVYSTEREHFVAVFDNITERKKADDALRQSVETARQRAEELEKLMDMVPAGIWISQDSECRLIIGNRAAGEMSETVSGRDVSAGTTGGQVLNTERRWSKDGRELKPEELPMQVAASKGVEVLDYEMDALLPSGRQITMFGNARPLFDDKGQVRGCIAVYFDITKRKRAEEALKKAHATLEEKVKERTVELEKAYNSLKESEAGLAEAQELAHIGSWERNFVTNKFNWSDEMYRIFGLRPQEFEVNFHTFLNYVHPDDQDKIYDAVKRALKGKPFDTDFRIIPAHGDERIVHAKGEVVFDDNNNPVRIKGTTQDITERKMTEEASRESEERLRLAQQAAKIGAFEWNIQTGVNTWTPELEAMYGLQPGEFGKTEDAWEQLVHPEDRQNTILAVDQAFQTGEPVTHEWRVVWPDGSVHWLTGRWQVFKNITGKPLRMTGVNIDITAQKEAEEALKDFEIARKKEIHHRIKNNLQVIYSLLDLQAEKFKSRKNIRDSEVLNAFKESMDRVLSIALIHEELYKGKNIDLLNFPQYIKELAENLILTYKLESDVSYNFDLEENIFLDMDTAIPLGIIINELVTNSFKYAFSGRDKGEIRIKLNREKNGECKIENCKNAVFVLTVSDNGIGIPKNLNIEDLDSLGLQLVTILVDQLDGELELKRDNGTEFIIRFMVTENNNSVSVPTTQLSL